MTAQTDTGVFFKKQLDLFRSRRVRQHKLDCTLKACLSENNKTGTSNVLSELFDKDIKQIVASFTKEKKKRWHETFVNMIDSRGRALNRRH